MPGIPPHKNRTDHGVASGSSVAHVTGHARTQVHAHNNTKKKKKQHKHSYAEVDAHRQTGTNCTYFRYSDTQTVM